MAKETTVQVNTTAKSDDVVGTDSPESTSKPVTWHGRVYKSWADTPENVKRNIIAAGALKTVGVSGVDDTGKPCVGC